MGFLFFWVNYLLHLVFFIRSGSDGGIFVRSVIRILEELRDHKRSHHCQFEGVCQLIKRF